MCISSHALRRERQKTVVHRSLQNCGSSVWDLLHVTFLALNMEVAPRFWKICVSLPYAFILLPLFEP
jgi:hypothetical protein